MTRAAPDGAVFYKRLRFETDARLDYAFRVDGEHRLDPLNPAVVKSGMTGEANEVVMPGYRRSTPLVARAETTRGTLRVVNQEWAKSRVVVYLPAGYDPSREHPVVYTTDGGAWIDYVDLPAILDHLIAEGVIEPLIAVMIDPLEDRGPWYDFDSGYPAYLETVVAHVDGAFSTRTGAADRLHIGTSAGGRATLSVWLERPDLFRNLAMLSPALAGRRRSIESRFHGSGRDHGNLRVWLSAGTYEGAIHRETRVLERRLRSAGASTKAVYTHEGHSFGAWRNLTGAMLEYFFPLRPESPPAAPPRP
jgi:enterochelin esterase-like enzyme